VRRRSRKAHSIPGGGREEGGGNASEITTSIEFNCKSISGCREMRWERLPDTQERLLLVFIVTLDRGTVIVDTEP